MAQQSHLGHPWREMQEEPQQGYLMELQMAPPTQDHLGHEAAQSLQGSCDAARGGNTHKPAGSPRHAHRLFQTRYPPKMHQYENKASVQNTYASYCGISTKTRHQYKTHMLPTAASVRKQGISTKHICFLYCGIRQTISLGWSARRRQSERRTGRE